MTYNGHPFDVGRARTAHRFGNCPRDPKRWRGSRPIPADRRYPGRQADPGTTPRRGRAGRPGRRRTRRI
jgi:hypothetical protein